MIRASLPGGSGTIDIPAPSGYVTARDVTGYLGGPDGSDRYRLVAKDDQGNYAALKPDDWVPDGDVQVLTNHTVG